MVGLRQLARRKPHLTREEEEMKVGKIEQLTQEMDWHNSAIDGLATAIRSGFRIDIAIGA